jgi:hypothetical protein
MIKNELVQQWSAQNFKFSDFPKWTLRDFKPAAENYPTETLEYSNRAVIPAQVGIS